ncbi:CRACD-like protein isoform X1 [Pseudoliparis swirei]|uniref:CRACD-like protein isoform X1 n=1 Tax=Pseudoliparis swirei TaxID=2059687 RepID=UPI0024BEF9AA|nr:CRACD-like protein isoform X1 [Pseudoliparis swirei]XP_056284603.1 CRACD-like protein isoform X1 [Pseudoliparis swirei]XP_056284604.1 CRACD-like protein isoform X1 [Pseudoliparis swirei]
MAAIDLERGLEHSGRAWGKERPELMDNFDSEMQEWEDQLQDIQQKIEELYNGVQARRGANDVTTDNQTNGGQLECGLGRHGDGKNHPGATTVPHHHSNGCNYSPGGYGYPVSHQRGYCHADSEIGDLLQDYLGQGQEMSPKNNGARHVRFSDTLKVSPATEIRKSPGSERLGQERLPASFEQTKNKKNQVSHMKSSPNKENTGAKPPLGQQDAPAVQPRSQPPAAPAESPAPDRKAFGPGVLGDRKCASPSVLRKFGAMLQENEGKMLNESGVVTHQGPVPEPKCLTPACQRRALGATAVAGKAPLRAPVQKCQADSDALTAETEPGQEWGLASDSGRRNHKDHRGAYAGPKGSQRGPQQSQRRSQASPKIRPRANSGADRDGGPAQGERARRPACQHVEPKMDNGVLSASAGAQKNHRGGLAGQDEGLIELLDMLEIQHEYSSSPRAGHTAYRQDPRQVNPAQPSPDNLNSSFSRPTRPANQRPPSRWAARTPTAIITSPSGPIYCPTSPLTRPRSPMTRTPSPALKHRPLVSYSLQTETVIM